MFFLNLLSNFSVPGKTAAIAFILIVSNPVLAQVIELGPSPYLQQSDSPFNDLSFDYFYLEDFEDGSFNTPGVSYSPAWQVGTGGIYTDSVDGDDGVIDGSGRNGKDIFSKRLYENLTVTFDLGLLGVLPTHVGIVWTDAGRNGGGQPLTHPLPVVFEFTSANGTRLDSATVHQVGDGLITGQTDEDRFFGAIYDAGILSMTLRMPGYTNWSLDHVQYGFQSPISICNGLPVNIFIENGDLPTSGDDVILGTSGADIINALAGNDTICSLGGADIINAGGGDDWVDSAGGSDEIFGGGGADSLYAGSGNDMVDGGSGDDDIEGNEGGDMLFGRSGDDAIDGGSGVDEISGGPGGDTIFAGSGAAVGSGFSVSGGSGADFIFGGPDADLIKGGGGADVIRGAEGNDVITGGVGRDEIYGDEGNDDIKGQVSIDTLHGGNGRDVITGGSAADVINGGPGDDTLTGGSGDDVINGDAGSDRIFGGSDDDEMDGGASAGDSCNGQSGVDTATAACETVVGVP